jgi:hypothetical protein
LWDPLAGGTGQARRERTSNGTGQSEDWERLLEDRLVLLGRVEDSVGCGTGPAALWVSLTREQAKVPVSPNVRFYFGIFQVNSLFSVRVFRVF